MTCPSLLFSSPEFSSWSPRAVQAAVWALGEAGEHFFRWQHSWESTQGSWCCLCTLPSIAVLQHIWLGDVSHLSSKEETTSPSYFPDHFFPKEKLAD